MELTIVSACFYSDEAPAWKLKHSCERLGLNLSLYGHAEVGKDWRNMKVVRLLKHLQSIKTEYVLYTDAGDSWMITSAISPEESIIEKFLNKNAKIVISGERNLYPPSEELSHAYPQAPTSLRYICAGSFIGRTKDVKLALTLLLLYPEDGNDQLLWHKLYLEDKFDIKIDHRAELFLAMGGIELDEINLNPCKFNETGEEPCVIHFNGGKGGSPNELNMNKTWHLQWV